MLLDDEPWELKGMETMIPWETGGFRVEHALDKPEEALRLLQTEKIDVLLTDIRMPGMSGIELAEKLRGRGIDTEVVFLSGYAEFDYAQRAVKTRAFDYLLKPFNLEEMPAFLDRLRRRLEQNRHINSLIRNDVIMSPRVQDGDYNGKMILKAIVEYLDAHYVSSLTLADVAANCGTNSTSAERLFRKYLGTTFVKYLTTFRITKACELLRTNEELSIEEISVKTGYEDYFYFSKVFKKEMGITPSRYRKNLSKRIEG
jgi:YesN/AraC family two-component response regulator